MENIAEALILAIQYIADREEDWTEDEDCKALEVAAGILSNASQEEKDLLIRIAKKLGLPEWSEDIGIGDND